MKNQQAFHIVTGKNITQLLDNSKNEIIEIVKAAYLDHYDNKTINPDSYFLRFGETSRNRIIALPASIQGDHPVSGIKWIASYPGNTEHNLQRASATLVLNSYETGYPIALLEASQISAARTAASCVLAAHVLSGQKHIEHLSIVGAGLIARVIVQYFIADGWIFDSVTICSLSETDSKNLATLFTPTCNNVIIEADAETAISGSSHVLLATTAGEPYLKRENLFSPGQIILNISLRDIAPELILNAFNVFDDVEHCLKASTSPHLAEQISGGREFVNGVIAEVVNGTLQTDKSRPIIFSPFGLGVLDVAVGQYLLEQAKAAGTAIEVDGFFPNTDRW